MNKQQKAENEDHVRTLTKALSTANVIIPKLLAVLEKRSLEDENIDDAVSDFHFAVESLGETLDMAS